MPSQAGGGGGGATTTWPLGIVDQANAIAAAISVHNVPAQVFMGMYNVETGLGSGVRTSSAGAVGPFQFTGADKGTGVLYPMTNTPSLKEFQEQANAAAAYLRALYVGAPAAAHNWHFALQAYNAGPLGAQNGGGQSYADSALAFRIPDNWKIALAGATGLSASQLGPAAPGGTAGAGGTGTLLNDSSGFTVGDPTNPDEDFWTAMNRIAQERYWYLFSDGETLYLADGPDLMKQTPALDIDRVANAANINHMDFTWDNTAWTYSATHKRRKHTQRRTQLAKITSPVEAQLDYICAIDEVRAGDVANMSSCGPGDGQWLAGDVRRSVFEVFSEINLVVALTPLTEGALNPAGVNPNNTSLAPLLPGSVGSIKGYANPVGNWSPSRIDQGVDGTLASAYVAPGDSQIKKIYNSQGAGSWRGYWIAGMFTSGPFKGKVWYVAEGIAPIVPEGASVKAGTPVARPVPSGFNGITGNIETGWANPGNPSQTLAQSLPGYGGDQSPQAIACGNSFNRFLGKLGAKPGSLQGAGVHVAPASMPGGYP